MKLPAEHQAVLDAIKNSEHKYVTKNMILAQLNKPESYRRNVEQIISDLVVKYGQPVGASSAAETKGYFIIKNKHDLHVAKRDISSRTYSMNLRYKALQKLDIS
jgi:hypothetical protein